MSRKKRKQRPTTDAPDIDWDRLARATPEELKDLHLLQRAVDRHKTRRTEEHPPQSLADAVNVRPVLRVRGQLKQRKRKEPKSGAKTQRSKSSRVRARCQANAASGERCKIVGSLRDGLCGVHQKHGKFQRNLARSRKKQASKRDQYRNEYLLSKHWLDFKAKYYTTHPRECAFCYSTGRVDLHHKTYARVGHEHEGDVVPLCRLHHDAVHQYHQENPDQSLAEATDRWLRTASPVAA